MNTANIVELNSRKFQAAKIQSNPVKDFLHDIRSPLQALQALASEHGLTPTESDKMYKSCMSRIVSLTENSARKQNQTTTICLANMFNSLKKEKELELSCAISTAILLNNPWITIDLSEEQLKNILSNLINNSVNANSTSITLRAKIMRSVLKIEVIDSGKGIDANTISKIGHYGQTYTKGGQGLGLTNAINTIRNAGGDISCRSIPNVITQFTISLPL